MFKCTRRRSAFVSLVNYQPSNVIIYFRQTEMPTAEVKCAEHGSI